MPVPCMEKHTCVRARREVFGSDPCPAKKVSEITCDDLAEEPERGDSMAGTWKRLIRCSTAAVMLGGDDDDDDDVDAELLLQPSLFRTQED